MKARLVLDTNVWIAALRSRRGASRAVIDTILDRQVTLHLTVPLVMEYEAVFRRQRHLLGLSEHEIDELLDLICAIGDPHEVYYLWRWQVADPQDAHVLEAAVVASCDALLTFNKRDLHEAEQFGVQLCTPGEWLAINRT